MKESGESLWLCFQGGRQSTERYAKVDVMIIDKRSCVRKRLNFYVDVYSFEEYMGFYQTRDIDRRGAFLKNYASVLYPGDWIELHLRVHDGERSPFRLRATVARSTDEGVAVLFDHGAQEYRRLLQLLSSYASDGDALTAPRLPASAQRRTAQRA